MEEDKTVNTEKEDLFSKHRDRITPAYQRAVREALLRHKKAGNSVAIWQGGKVVILQPEEIEFE